MLNRKLNPVGTEGQTVIESTDSGGLTFGTDRVLGATIWNAPVDK